MACFKLSFLEHLFSVPTKRYWTQLSEHTPFPQPLLFHCYPKRKGKLWKLTEWLISSSVRHTNTAGNNRPTIFSHAFFCNLADNLSLAQINAFAPHLSFSTSSCRVFPKRSLYLSAKSCCSNHCLVSIKLEVLWFWRIQELFYKSHLLGTLQRVCSVSVFSSHC